MDHMALFIAEAISCRHVPKFHRMMMLPNLYATGARSVTFYAMVRVT